jgi:hypothetical protein
VRVLLERTADDGVEHLGAADTDIDEAET